MTGKCAAWLLTSCLFLTACGAAGTGSSEANMKEESGAENYAGKVREDLVPLAEVRGAYREEADRLLEEDERIGFKGCRFESFPEAEEVCLLAREEKEATPEEALSIIKEWLRETGQEGEVDLARDVRIVTDEREWDTKKEGAYMYPALADCMDLASGSGAVITTDGCHIQIGGDSIYSMSTGEITEYAGGGLMAGSDAMGACSEAVIKSGRVEDLAEESYPLIGGECTVGEAAETVKTYLEKGTPYPPEEGVTISVPEVRVFALGDACGFDFLVSRSFEGIPVAFSDYGTYVPRSGFISEETLHVYAASPEHVSAFAGRNMSGRLVKLLTSDRLLPLGEACRILREGLAGELNVEVREAGLFYVPVSETEDGTDLMRPAWYMKGVNTVKGEGIVMAVDALTGDIFMYTTDLKED